MKVKRLTAAILAAAITVSSIAPEAFAEISGAGGMSTVNESADDTSTDPASGGSDKAEESGKTVSASEPGEGESDYTYNALDDGTIEITGYSGSAENIVIPAQIDGKSVTRIGNNAFEKSSAKEIVIPDSVTEIGSQAFSGCGKLTGVSIPNSVTMIRDRAFFDCNSLASITIPDSVTDIELQAFCNCTSLKSVTIPASVTDIGDEAFGYYFNDIDESEIKKVDGFKINYVKNTYGHYYATKNGFSDEDCLLTIELNDGTLEISKYVGNSATYEIPGEIDGKKVIRIGNSAFIDCTELTSVTIPDGVTDIRWRAFYNCVSLKSVTIPKSVTYIDSYAFGYYYDSDSFATKKIDGFKINYVKNTYGHMYALKNGFTDEACLLTHELYDGTLEITEYVGNSATYVIPSEIDGKRVTQIGYDAFNDCTELTSITIPDGVTCIGNSAFSYCTSLETVTIPNSVTQIYPRAFYDCTLLKEVTIPASVTSIGNEAFGYYYVRDSSETKKADGFKINYVNNTRGHWYAIKNGFTDGTCFVVNELDDGTAEITGYAGNSATCVIPDEIHGKKVTRIGDSAFIDRTELTSVTIPDGVTYIVDCAFFGCTSLETVTIPNSVINICSSAFYNCTSLKEVTIPASVTDIGDEAFGYYYDRDSWKEKKVDGFKINYVNNTRGHWYAIKNGFTDGTCFVVNELDDGTAEITGYAGNSATCVIPDEIHGKKVTRIGDSAFIDRTELTSVTIPDGVTYIVDCAFFGCTSLETVTIPNSVINICSSAFYNCTSLKEVTIPASVTYIGDEAFGYYSDIDGSEIKKVDGFRINYVKNTYGHYYATKNGFSDEDCLLTIELNDGTLEISKYVGNSATYEIPGEIDGKKVIRIGNSAFIDCTELTSVTIPDGVTDIRWRAFYNCVSLKSVTIPKSVTYIDSYAFGYYYDSDSFATKKIDGFKINYVKNTYGHMYAIKNGFTDEACLLTNELDDGTLEITKYVGNSATCVIPSEIDGKKVTQIGYNAFSSRTELTSITIPDGVTIIGNSAFSDCTSLETVTIPNSVTQIYPRAFYDCTLLKEVTIPASVTSIGNEAFGYYYVRDSSETKKADGFKINYVNNTRGHWYAIKNGFTDGTCFVVNELDDGTAEITGYAGNSATCVIPDEIHGKKVTRIGENAFRDRTELTSVTIPDSVKYIFDRAFSNCTSLETVTIPNSVTDIYSRAFYNCTSLKEVTIPASVTDIGDEAFGYYRYEDTWESKKVDGFKINYVKNTYGHYYATENGFSDEACLLTNELNDGTLEISKYAGNSATSATYVIPGEINGKKVTQIGDSAFTVCTSLTSVTIPDGVTSIDEAAFWGCTSLTSVTIPDSVTSIKSKAFFNCTSLKSVTIPASVTNINIGDYALGYYEIYNTDSCEWEMYKVDGFKINYVKNTYGHMYAFKNGFTDEACLLANELDDGTLEITKYAGNSATYVIPGEIDGKKVTEIGDSTFKGCTELTSITIPDGVIGIGNNAFSGCTSLETVTIPASVTYVGNSAFYGCTSLKSVTVPESVTYIGGYAFAECYSLKYADIPANVTGIGTSPFCNCRSLENINTDEANKCYTTVDGVLYDKDKTELINYPAGKKDSSYVIPEGIRTIREKAFYGCLNLCELTIPDSVTEIESGAFECSSLISDEYGTIKYVDDWVVGSGHTANVVLKDGTRGIAFEAFSGDGIIEKVTMPDTVKYINGCAFENCTNLSEVLLSSSLENIERGAFLNCSNLADIVIPDSVISITSDAFYNTALLNKQNTPVKYAGKWVITAEDCDKIVIKDGTKCIASYAFSSCTSLTDITIPDSVTMIGDYAFATCNSLTEIKIPNNVKSIGGCVFWFCGSLKNVTIPDSVTMIGDKAFFGCTSLTDITIPGSVTMIGNAAFAGCKSLTDITISDGVTMIGNKAFSGCTSLTDITIPGSVTMIGNAAFSSCTSLTDITIPDSVTSIGGSAFYNCPKLLDVTIPDSVTNIDDWAFGFDENDEKIDGFKIYCYGGTAGEQYAKDNGFEYKILECKVHKFGEWTITEEASCTKDGEKVRVCSLCNKTETETIPATGHTEVIDKAVAATCTKTGLTEGIHCSVCNAVIKAQETVPAKGHKYVDTVVKPTYTAKGYTLHKCSVCGESYKDTYTAKLTLAKVTGVKLGGRAADALRINWSKNASADGYIVEMYQGNKWVRVEKITNNSTTTFRKAGLSASTVYKFRVRAYKMEGKTAVYSAYSTELAARTNPSVMTGAKLTGRAADALRINWSKNASADGYIVEMYQGDKWVRVAKITSNATTTYRASGLSASTVYKFRVRAYKMSGSTALYGNYSATVAARTNPSVIKGAKLGGRAADALRINWSKNASADGYIVEMYQGNKWVRVAKITSNGTTTFRKAGLKASSVYKFRVRAYKMSGKTALYGNYSATVTARTNPSVMTGVKIAGKAKDALRVNWTKNTSAQGYIVEMYKGGKWVRVAKITNGNTTTYRKVGLAKNTAYKFRVCAYYMSGKTALYSNYGSVSGKTAAK